MLGLLFATIVFIGLAILIRALARHNILWVIIPANCYVLVTTQKNKTGDLTQGGGGVVNILHNIPGKKLIKKNHDLMKWYFTTGRESRNILSVLLGVEWIGPFRALRTNKVRRFRYGKIKDEVKKDGKSQSAEEKKKVGDYFIQSDDFTTPYIPFSGEMAILVTEVETKAVFELNFLFNIIEEAIRPLASIRVADANAILAGMIKQEVNQIVGSGEPEYFIKASSKSTGEIVEAARIATKVSEEEIGKKIVTINLVSTDMDEKDRELFELSAKTDLQNTAAIKVAEKDKKVKILANDADADRVARVIKPAAENERTVAVRVAEAYENNKSITTYAPGADKMVPLGK